MRRLANITALLSLIFIVSEAAYLPQLQMCASTVFINKQLTKYGPDIMKKIEKTKIPDQHFDDKVDGVHVQFNLTQIKPTFNISWQANVINIKDEHTFTLMSKNINMTMNAHIQFKVGVALKQKGQLVIDIQKMQADTTLFFSQPHCSSSQNQGLGFDIQIQSLYVNTQKVTIKITHKGIDNAVIKAVMNLLSSRLPAIIQKQAKEVGNPIISKTTCSAVQQLLPLGQQKYVVIVNTTNVPHFIGKSLYAALDITFMNVVTNATNDQIENDNFPQINMFEQKAELSLLASSNMMNSVMWLIDDSKILNINVTNKRLGPNPPIQLNTLNLSILIPGLLKYGRKQVILLISTSNKFSHLYIRNGKIVAAASVSIKFVVNQTGYGVQTVQQCIQKKQCIVACDLNATIPFSAAVQVTQGNVLKGLVHTVQIVELTTISSQIPIKNDQLKKILNTMIGSFRPQINQQIQEGMPLNISKLAQYEVQGVLMKVKKDYAAVGLVFEK